MIDAFRTVEDYELFLYSLPEHYPSIRRSSLTLIRRGATLGRVTGEIEFEQGYKAVIRERLVFDGLPISIDSYGYEIWCGSDKLCWYDSQPHPDDPNLQATHPHHKHIPPDIKHNRVPAPSMSFTRPNLPDLIVEIEMLIAPTDTQ